MDDQQLLREYVASHSETAFRALVERYVPLVYGAALRQLNNSSQADDVTQAVFIILARKAAGLPKGTILSGWLYRATRFTADKARRAEYRRQQREHEALQMQTTATDPDWSVLAPVLDDAMAQLHHGDRTVLLLRFFENKSLKDVGHAIGISEDTAQKRVSRAILKLRGLFVKQGVSVSAAGMTTAISAHAAPTVPAHLSAAIATTGLAHQTASAAMQGLAQSFLHRWFLQKAIAGGLVGSIVLVISFIFLFSPKHPAPNPQQFTPGPASVVLRIPGAAPAARPVPAARGPATIRLVLTGTPGLKFEVVYSHDAETRTISGILPSEISFRADAFTASITIHDTGQFGYQIYRNDRLAANGGPTTVIGANRTFSLQGLAGGRGFRFNAGGN